MTAFIELLSEKGFEKITINDIAEQANINRGTVYLHYTDKFDLMDKCVELHVEQLINYCDNNEDTNLSKDAFQSIFEYLEKNYAIYKLLLSNESIGFFRKRLYASFTQIGTDVISIQSDNSALSKCITTHFLASGLIGMIEWWIDNSMPCTIQEITTQLMYLLSPYTKSFGFRT